MNEAKNLPHPVQGLVHQEPGYQTDLVKRLMRSASRLCSMASIRIYSVSKRSDTNYMLYLKTNESGAEAAASTMSIGTRLYQTVHKKRHVHVCMYTLHVHVPMPLGLGVFKRSATKNAPKVPSAAFCGNRNQAKHGSSRTTPILYIKLNTALPQQPEKG